MLREQQFCILLILLPFAEAFCFLAAKLGVAASDGAGRKVEPDRILDAVDEKIVGDNVGEERASSWFAADHVLAVAAKFRLDPKRGRHGKEEEQTHDERF